MKSNISRLRQNLGWRLTLLLVIGAGVFCSFGFEILRVAVKDEEKMGIA